MPVAVGDRGGAVALMLASLILLGTWPALLTLLERRGRLPQHTYLDYSITNLVAAVLMAIAFGQVGDSRPDFFTQLTQDNWPSVLIAMAGGLALSLGNLVSQYAWAFAGLSVTNVICSSMTVVAGTTINYFLDGRINRAEILFPGVVCFLVAVFLGAAVHSSNAKDDEQKLSMKSADIELSSDFSDEAKLLPAPEESKNGDEDDYSASNEAKPGTAEFIIQVAERRSIKVLGHSKLLGLGLVSLAGACFSLFSPAINLATNDQWRALRKGVPHLLVYTAFFYFSVSCFVLGACLNVWLLYYPMAGVPASTTGAYARDWNGRHWALLAGLLCGFGNGFQFMGGQAAGYAAADAVQALPLVSTFWGVILFSEYRRSSRKTYLLLSSMLSMFIIAVAVLMASAGHRKGFDTNAKFIATRLHRSSVYQDSTHN
uniref:Permease n=1 Tax=Saccharum hybrid cultivar R570 TaxID=131158 RepID=A0A059Q2P4_9POAL|nr:permease [Saccharum hybrid cultivar R570]